MEKQFIDPNTRLSDIDAFKRYGVAAQIEDFKNVRTVGDLYNLRKTVSREDFRITFLKLRNCGRVTAERIADWVDKHDLYVGAAEKNAPLSATEYIRKTAQLAIVKELVQEYGGGVTLEEIVKNLNRSLEL